MDTIDIVRDDAEFLVIRRLFGHYKRAVEGYASAADVCA